MSQRHPRAGEAAQAADLIDVTQLFDDYYQLQPNYEDAAQQVIFGTSGHRGSASRGTFNEAHLLAIAQAIIEIRQQLGVSGPCFIGKDTHALSTPALQTILEVFTAHRITVVIAAESGYTPTPVISHAIIQYNQQHSSLADGIVITPSHNPPQDGGIKYNWINGGPADITLTKAIEQRANAILATALQQVKRLSYAEAMRSGLVQQVAFEQNYIADLAQVIDMQAIAQSQLHIGVDPLGGAGSAYWPLIAEHYGLNLQVVNQQIDPTFRFMHLDHDGVIRMDCSSRYAMAGLLQLSQQFDLALGNDTDFDRHGIVTTDGLMEANAYLAVAADYLLQHRPQWRTDVAIAKTLVTSAMLDRVTIGQQRQIAEYPVGFKWYAEGLQQGRYGFVCEESAGATLLRHDGGVWTTDKDGIVAGLLAAEIMAKTGKNPHHYYQDLTAQYGQSYYARIQAPASFVQKQRLAKLDTQQFKLDSLAGEPITTCLTTAPANQAPIGGLKVITQRGWFVARPSGTEEAYKIYAESFISQQHLQQLLQEAQMVVNHALSQA